MKLLPSQWVLRTPYHFMQSLICKVYACLAVTCHPHFWQNDQGLFTSVSTESDHGEENSPAAPAGIRTCDLSEHEPSALTTELSPFLFWSSLPVLKICYKTCNNALKQKQGIHLIIHVNACTPLAGCFACGLCVRSEIWRR